MAKLIQIVGDSVVGMKNFSAVLTDGGVVVPARNEADSLYQDGYGSLEGDARVLTLEPFEALYLVERGKIAVVDEGTRDRLVFRELLGRFSARDSDAWTRYIVYRDLRTRGFVARGGPGPGVDFLVYERGSHGKKQPRYLVHAVWEGAREPLKHLGEVLDAAEEANRILRLAVVDRRGEIVYYTLKEGIQ